jgi:hypothetical protein
MTKYEPAIPLRPSGLPSVNSRDTIRVGAATLAARFGGTEPSPSLALLDVARCYAIGAPPKIWLRGARNAARPPFSATC